MRSTIPKPFGARPNLRRRECYSDFCAIQVIDIACSELNGASNARPKRDGVRTFMTPPIPRLSFKEKLIKRGPVWRLGDETFALGRRCAPPDEVDDRLAAHLDDPARAARDDSQSLRIVRIGGPRAIRIIN